MYILKSLGRQGSGNDNELQDYDEYRMNVKDIVICIVEGLVLIALIAYVFYRSPIALLVLIPALIPFIDYKRKQKIEKRKKELTLQFREMMYSLIAGLQAGYSVENAFKNSHSDLVLLFGEDEMMPKEVEIINRGLRNNINIEELLFDLSRRSHIRDITDFAEVFSIAKRSGGNLPEILNNTATAISDRIDVSREIETQVSAKKMEQRIMDLVPFGIILYIDSTTPGFFDPLYHNIAGVTLMTVLLVVYVIAFLLGEKILKISY